MSELPYLLTATPSEHPRGASSQPAIDPMPTPLTAKLAGVPGLDIAGIVNRGLEKNENAEEAVLREVKEELGIESELLCKIGIVSDYYNAVNRHNINHYYLCKMKSRGEQELTDYEKNDFQMKVLTLGYEEAVKLYERQTDKKLGRLLTNRELPIVKVAKQWLDENQ